MYSNAIFFILRLSRESGIAAVERVPGKTTAHSAVPQLALPAAVDKSQHDD